MEMQNDSPLDFMENKGKNVEIDDLDNDVVLVRRESKINEQLEKAISLLKDSNCTAKRDGEEPIKPPNQKDSLRLSGLLRSSVSFSKMKEHLQRQTIPEELTSLITETINQIERIIDMTVTLAQKFWKDDKRVQQMCDVQKTAYICSLQLQELISILSLNDTQAEDAAKIVEEFEGLEEFCICLQSKHDVNPSVIQSTLNQLSSTILSDIEKCYSVLLDTKLSDKEAITDVFNDAKIAHSKLKTAVQVFPYAVVFDKKDLFSLSTNDPEWDKLRKKTIFKQLSDPEVLKKSFKKVVKSVILANAIISSSQDKGSAFEKSLHQNFGALYYIFQSQQAYRKAQIFISEPRASSAIQVWNLMDTGFVKFAMSVMFPSIKYHKKIYITPIATRITLDSIKAEYADGSINKIDSISLKSLDLNIEKDQENTYYSELSKKGSDKITVRILCSRALNRPEPDSVEQTCGAIQQLDKIFNKVKEIFKPKKPDFESIVIHIHGGGFVAMSSRCHQTYSRQWANSLNVPIFSIDYKKAPQHPYPAALDDVWQAYNWILNYVSKFFNISPKKIVLVGDSAGGNLVTALTLRCIKNGIRVPDGILIVYPALNLNLRYFTPSFLLSLDDQILPHTFLKMCLSAYVPEGLGLLPGSDPFISPSYASDELLKELPPTRIMAGTNDPLHDECWRFLRRLEGLNKDVKMVVYNQMPHGFLNYDAPSGMKEAKICVRDASDFLKELLSSS